MRELSVNEITMVAGGDEHVCTASDGANLLGVDTTTLGEALVNGYEGLVWATSHIIERVANAIG